MLRPQQHNNKQTQNTKKLGWSCQATGVARAPNSWQAQHAHTIAKRACNMKLAHALALRAYTLGTSIHYKLKSRAHAIYPLEGRTYTIQSQHAHTLTSHAYKSQYTHTNHS